MTLKGRHWVLLWLALFLLVAAIVTMRGTVAYRLSRELTQLHTERASLEGVRADLERRISAGSSRMVLLDRARKAGLHIATDSEIKLFQVPGGSSEGAR
jgi:cell division protein FtsL